MILCGWLAQPVLAQTLPVAGTGHDTWIVLSDAQQGLTVLQRQAGDPDHKVWKVTQVPGLLAPGGVTAGDQTLWLVYRNGIVQSMKLTRDPLLPQMRFSQASFHPALPAGSTIRSLAASSHGLWALLEITDQAGVDQLDGVSRPATTPATPSATEPAPASADQAASSPASTDTQADTQAGTQAGTQEEAAVADTSASLDPPVLRLARLHRGRWSAVPLPDDWPARSRGWVAFILPDQATPLLIAEAPQGQQDRLRIYRQHGQEGTWQSRDHTVPTGGDIAFLGVQQQLVMARRDDDAPSLSVTLWVLRPEREEAVHVGQLRMDDQDTKGAAASIDKLWGVAPHGLSAAIIRLEDPQTASMTAMDLQGQVTLPVGDLTIEQPPQFVQDPGQTLLVAVVAVSIFLMFIIWRRDPNRADVALPPHVTLADVGRRAAAAGVDLVPCVLIAMFATSTPLSQLQRTWPGRSATWEDMLPGILAIGLFVLHTGLSEAFTGRTLGKAIFGLRVISMDGTPPNIWQVLARNVLKSFDLIAFYILPILALVSRHRQRLGDLVGKTLVVTAAHQPPDDRAGGKDEDTDQDADKDVHKSTHQDQDSAS